MSQRISITVNQETTEIPERATLANLVSKQGFYEPFAIALNGRFIAKERYAEIRLSEFDVVDVMSPIEGG